MPEKDSIKKHLDNFSETLSSATQKSLDTIRHQVMASVDAPKWQLKLKLAILAPIVAMGLFAVLMTTYHQSKNQPTQSMEFNASIILHDLELLSYEIDDEILQDLDFFAWLEDENILDGEIL